MTCERSLDVVFALDSSADIGNSTFISIKSGLSEILEQYQVGLNDIQVGVTCSSLDPSCNIELGNHDNVSTLQMSIASLLYLPTDSNMPAAINRAVHQLINGRNGIPKILIVLSATNYNNFTSLSISAANAAINGIITFVVDFGGHLDSSVIVRDSIHLYSVANGDFTFTSFDNAMVMETCSGELLKWSTFTAEGEYSFSFLQSQLVKMQLMY